METRLSKALAFLNNSYGEVIKGWGTTFAMGGVMVLFLLFLTIIALSNASGNGTDASIQVEETDELSKTDKTMTYYSESHFLRY
jgi:hypothetical protein